MARKKRYNLWAYAFDEEGNPVAATWYLNGRKEAIGHHRYDSILPEGTYELCAEATIAGVKRRECKTIVLAEPTKVEFKLVAPYVPPPKPGVRRVVPVPEEKRTVTIRLSGNRTYGSATINYSFEGEPMLSLPPKLKPAVHISWSTVFGPTPWWRASGLGTPLPPYRVPEKRLGSYYELGRSGTISISLDPRVIEKIRFPRAGGAFSPTLTFGIWEKYGRSGKFHSQASVKMCMYARPGPEKCGAGTLGPIDITKSFVAWWTPPTVVPGIEVPRAPVAHKKAMTKLAGTWIVSPCGLGERRYHCDYYASIIVPKDKQVTIYWTHPTLEGPFWVKVFARKQPILNKGEMWRWEINAEYKKSFEHVGKDQKVTFTLPFSPGTNAYVLVAVGWYEYSRGCPHDPSIPEKPFPEDLWKRIYNVLPDVYIEIGEVPEVAAPAIETPTVAECSEGDVKYEGYTKYVCRAGRWVKVEEKAPEAGFPTEIAQEALMTQAIVHGKVYEEASGALIKGANVSIDGVSTTTDEKGAYFLTLAPGTYTMKVSKFGYGTKTRKLTLEKKEYEIDVALKPAPLPVKEIALGALVGGLIATALYKKKKST